jgi:hypothetical protein
VDEAAIRVDQEVAVVLDALADRVEQGGVAAASEVSGLLDAFERSIGELTAAGERVTCAGALGLYRDLAVAVNRLAAGGGRSIRSALAAAPGGPGA